MSESADYAAGNLSGTVVEARLFLVGRINHELAAVACAFAHGADAGARR